MSLLNKKDDEIFKIAEPIWDNLVKSSNIKDYGSFTKDFSSQMLYGANEVELGKQWAGNKLLTNLSEEKKFLGCLRRNNFVTVLLRCQFFRVPCLILDKTENLQLILKSVTKCIHLGLYFNGL